MVGIVIGDCDGRLAILSLIATDHLDVSHDQVEAMTFRKYIETYLCPGNAKDLVVKAARQVFYKDFLFFLEKTNHKDKELIRNEYAKLKIELSRPKQNIFTSFISLIEHLEKSKIAYSIVFRTFGTDLDMICDEVQQRTTMKIHSRGSFAAGQLQLNKSISLKTPQEMLRFIKPFQHGGWRDDWQYWHDHSETHAYGKPLPIDLADDKKIAIFFDDNALDKSILAAKVIGEESLDQAALQAKLIQQGNIVPVNTLFAILDPNYFVKCVEFKLKMAKQECKEAAREFKVFAI